jgi:hypothetical protein
MPTDPLVAMFAGGNESAAAANPFMLEAAPQLQLAGQLQQAGMSTAPAYPAQAWGRLAQALAGTVMRHEATSDLAKAISGTAKKMAQLYPEGSIMRAGLSSDDPLVQAEMWQHIPKTVPLLSQAEKLGPNEVVRGIPAGAPANQPLATGSPALGGAAAGAEAKGRAPYMGGGPATVETLQGPREIEQTALERAQAAQGRAAGVSKPQLQPPLPQGEQPQSGTLQPQSGTLQPQSGILQPQSGVLQREFGSVMQGKPLGNPAIQPLVDIDTKELAQDREAAGKGAQDIANVRMIQDFLPKVTTGWSAESKLEGARILKAGGVSDDKINEFLKTDVTAGQLLQKKFLELSAGAARGMGAREPGSVIQMFAKAYPNLGTDRGAVTLQTNALYMDRLRTQQLAQDKTNYLNESVNGVQRTGQYRGLRGFNEQFAKTHGPETYVRAAEAMSGPNYIQWDKIKSTAERNAIVNLIPPGHQFYAPDQNGKMQVYTKPGGAATQ